LLEINGNSTWVFLLCERNPGDDSKQANRCCDFAKPEEHAPLDFHLGVEKAASESGPYN
jgi:hypothetical protein